MGRYALLTVDFDGTDEQKAEFDKYLANNKWQKVRDLPDSWSCLFLEETSHIVPVNSAQAVVRAAVSSLSIPTFRAVVHVGENAPTTF